MKIEEMKTATFVAGFAAVAVVAMGCSRPSVSDADDKAADAAIKGLTDSMQPGDAMKKAMEPTTPPAGDTKPTTTIVSSKKVPLIVTASGLRYCDLKVGKGATPELWQTVTVNYTETALDGAKIEPSLDYHTPFEFPIEGLRGWEEGVFTMKIGGKRRLIVPANMTDVSSNMSYVTKTRMGSIGGGVPDNTLLIYDVELLGAKENRDVTHPTSNNLTD